MTRAAATSEAAILRAIQLELGSMFDVRVLRNNVGKARDPSTGQVVQFGTPGMTDLLVLLLGGAVIWMEVKSETGKLRPDQETFRDVVQRLGHRWCVVRSAGEARNIVEHALWQEKQIRGGGAR